ncbi:MAG: NAD(+)/NADH kinase [bacterium]|nr:NAD(+)/NADH kinase [bacterium]
MIKRASIYWWHDNPKAARWAGKIDAWLKKKYPKIKLDEKNPQVLIVLGGDGTILDAAQRFRKGSPLIIGLNLGFVGFLASVREPKNFFKALDKFLEGHFKVAERMMIGVEVFRKRKSIFISHAINEVVLQNLLGLVEIEVNIDGHSVQYVRGTGIMAATATGSTAYNLSAHGPIVMPDIKCMILTEIMDHNIPTPSIVVKRDREINLKVVNFRKRGLLRISATDKPVDVILSVDGSENIFPLEVGDVIKIRRSPGLIKFAELESAYFFKSLREQFAFR